MNIEKLKKFVAHLNDLIEDNGEDAPITLGQLRDMIQENILRKELKEAQSTFFVTQDEQDLAQANLSNERFHGWLNEHYLIKSPAMDIRKEFDKVFPVEKI